MRLISLQQAKQAPECSLLHIDHLQLLLECPLDISALSRFLPSLEMNDRNAKRAKLSESKKENSFSDQLKFPFTQVGGKVFIDAEPWYKSADLSILNISLINAVIVSTPESMLGLPFLTRNPEFIGKILVTEATATVGKLAMEELVAFHEEFSKLYGQPITSSSETSPLFTDPELMEHLPQELKSLLLGECCSDISNWHRMYSAEDITTCMSRVQTLRYGEEATVDGYMTLTPFSSGHCIGASNWSIKGVCSNVTYISAYEVVSNHCANPDVAALEDSQVVLFAGSQLEDTTSLSKPDAVVEKYGRRPWATAPVKFATPVSRLQCSSSKMQSETAGSAMRITLSQIGSAVVDSVTRGGSVLLPVDVSDKVLEYVETISSALTSSNMGHVPMYFVSPSAEEFLAYANTVPEWLSPSRQEKLYAGESLFGHTELVRSQRLHSLQCVSSPKALELWQEPCIALAGHTSLRMGPSVHLLHRWRKRTECLLLLATKPGDDVDHTLSPFKPLCMQVRHFSPVSSGPRSTPWLERIRPKVVLMPESLKTTIPAGGTESQTIIYAHRLPVDFNDPSDSLKMNITADLAARIKERPAKLGNGTLARVSAEMHLEAGNFHLETPEVSRMTSLQHVFCGAPEVDAVLRVLRDKGLLDVEVSEQNGVRVFTIHSPSPARFEVTNHRTAIAANDPVVRRLIADAVTSCLQPV